jgi:hypothetical protein
VAEKPQSEGRSQPQAHEGGPQTAIAALQARLAQLEASAVRKNPRKDGKPHTDRTKVAVDSGPNKLQEGLRHAPGRLPGRLGSR